MSQLRAPKGFVDLLPDATGAWQHVEARTRDLMRRYDYGEIRVPVLELTQLFVRGVGEGTDIVSKEMYTFEDRGGRSLTLRPEFTAGVVRAYLEAGLSRSDPVQKWWYAGPVFRAENVQKGRQRQFHQIGCEALGLAQPGVDVEVIEVLWTLFQELGFEALSLRLNTLGCADDRVTYRDALVAFLRERLDALSADSQRRLEQNPLRVLDSKDHKDQQATADAPTPVDHICDACREHFEAVKSGLEQAGVTYVLDPRLVRGLDYYTRTVFELIDTGGSLGSQDALAGGGRYDGLVESLGGPATPACGWSLGFERLLLALPQQIDPAQPDAYIVSAGADAAAYDIARQLRTAGASVALDHRFGGVGKQMKRANRSGARYVIVVGADEASRGVASVKNMATGEQTEVALDALAAAVRD